MWPVSVMTKEKYSASMSRALTKREHMVCAGLSEFA